MASARPPGALVRLVATSANAAHVTSAHASADIARAIERLRVVALANRGSESSEGSENSEGSESSEGSEDSEGSEGSEDSEGKEVCEMELLQDLRATRPELEEWGVMVRAFEQFSRVLGVGRSLASGGRSRRQ